MRNRIVNVFAAVLGCGAVWAADSGYLREIEEFRAQQKASLKQDDGWLTVVGLWWLHEGENRVGAGDANQVVLPEGKAPASVGTIILAGEKTTFRPAAGVAVTVNGKPAVNSTLKVNDDIVEVNGLKFFLIKRGERIGVRVKDNHSAFRRDFTGLKWYPVDESWRITAKFVSYAQPRTMIFDDASGGKQKMESPGYVTFTREGHEYRLDPVLEDKELFFVIRDATSGKTTYGASRFLYADLPKDGTVVLDFNKAINPPCAFTPYATCPLPPPQNRLPIAVTAGEKKYGAEH